MDEKVLKDYAKLIVNNVKTQFWISKHLRVLTRFREFYLWISNKLKIFLKILLTLGMGCGIISSVVN